MIIPSYLLPRRISLSTNLVQSSTSHLIGASPSPEDMAFSLAQPTIPLETLKQSPEKFDDDYRVKLKELKLLPLETLTPNSGMVRISHGKKIDPVKLLQPVIASLDQETLEIALAAACCAPEYIYPDWLREYHELQHNIKFENDNLMEKCNIISSSELSFSKALYFFIIMR